MATMSLSPTTATAGRIPGHRRGRGSGIDIQISDTDEPQEKVTTQPLLLDDEKFDSILLPQSRQRRYYIALPWIASLILTSLVTYLLSTGSGQTSRGANGNFDIGYATELQPALSAISLHTRQFHGTLDFKDHRGFIPPGSPSLEYIGATDEVEKAWFELTRDRYFLLSDDEAREAYGNDPGQYWNVHHGGYVAGLDVLHSLHCLNHIRKALYSDVYPHDPVDGPMHEAHCIDHIRQLLMCNADLTAIPTQYFPGLQRNYINSSRPHTCRDFSKVREWATERFNGSTAVKARNRDGTLRANFYEPWSP